MYSKHENVNIAVYTAGLRQVSEATITAPLVQPQGEIPEDDRRKKSLDFEWFQFSNGRFSDPHTVVNIEQLLEQFWILNNIILDWFNWE